MATGWGDDETQALESSLQKHALLGQISSIESFFFPPEMIGGICPRVVGEEENIAWNAAAEALDSERIHIVWQTYENNIWYIATRSSDLASYPNSWCPFAALLPGGKDAAPPPAIYTFYSDESAVMMTVGPDSLQVHRGMSAVLRAKAQRASEELGGAPIIDLVPDRIEKMTPIPWFSVSLLEDRARRFLAGLSVMSALAVLGLALFVWFAASMAMLSARIDLNTIRQQSEKKSMDLLQMAQNMRSSTMRDQLATFTNINDSLVAINGYLEFYEIVEGHIVWRAMLPSNVTADRIAAIGGRTLESNEDGVIIGNSTEALKGVRRK